MNQTLVKDKKMADLLFILWAGGAALLSYSLVYALRKPYTAAEFEGLDFWGIDYKIAVTTIQILGYLISKFAGIKIISELKRERRFRLFVSFVVCAELSLVGFALIPHPYNAWAMFANGLSLGCMWGIIFSFIEGRCVTDVLASLLGVSIVFSSGISKSIGLFVMNELHISAFWMPALIGGLALPLLVLLGYSLKCLPNPSADDILQKSERVTLDKQARKALFMHYCPILSLLFLGNLMLLVLRDIKEDFLVNILDMSQQSSWLFAQVDSIVTLVILGLFALLTFCKKNFQALLILMLFVIAGCLTITYVATFHQVLNLSPITWLFIISLSLYVAYLTFQTIFFDRFIACFKIKGNVGFFIAMIDFIGYTGTVTLLFSKELLQIETDWFVLFNQMAAIVGGTCSVLFTCALLLLIREYQKSKQTGREISASVDSVQMMTC